MSIQTERSTSTRMPGSSTKQMRESVRVRAKSRSDSYSNFPWVARVCPYRNSGRFIAFDPEQALNGGRDDSRFRDPEFVDLDSELDYWRRLYRRQGERSGVRHVDHEPAVKLGLDAYVRSHGRSMDDMEEELRACYERIRGDSRLDWEQARPVVEAVWERVLRNGA